MSDYQAYLDLFQNRPSQLFQVGIAVVTIVPPSPDWVDLVDLEINFSDHSSFDLDVGWNLDADDLRIL